MRLHVRAVEGQLLGPALKRNPNAVQIGLTATPRTLRIGEADSEEAREDARIRADNIRHFGEPVYAYDIAQGIEDGYLAACEIVKRDVFLDARSEVEERTGLDPKEGRHSLRDALTGEAVGLSDTQQAHYDAGTFEGTVEMPERVAALCRDLFENLTLADPQRGPEQKTIIFCARDSHAERVAAELNNLYATWARSTGSPLASPFAFKCTAASGGADWSAS